MAILTMAAYSIVSCCLRTCSTSYSEVAHLVGVGVRLRLGLSIRVRVRV